MTSMPNLGASIAAPFLNGNLGLNLKIILTPIHKTKYPHVSLEVGPKFSQQHSTPLKNFVGRSSPLKSIQPSCTTPRPSVRIVVDTGLRRVKVGVVEWNTMGRQAIFCWDFCRYLRAVVEMWKKSRCVMTNYQLRHIHFVPKDDQTQYGMQISMGEQTVCNYISCKTMLQTQLLIEWFLGMCKQSCALARTCFREYVQVLCRGPFYRNFEPLQTQL